MKINKVIILSNVRSYFSSIFFQIIAKNKMPEDVKEEVL